MGLLSKLLGNEGKKAEQSLTSFFKEAAKELENIAKKKEDEKPSAPAATAAPVQTAPAEEEIRSDELWGEYMPKDENQFSFAGTYREYFEKIFREDFPELSFEHSTPQYYKADIYTFTKNGAKCLVIELLPKSSEAQKLRRDTLRAGIPYLRFYINCSEIGWWNARTYVTGKIKAALG